MQNLIRFMRSRFFWLSALLLVVFINTIAYFHAYKFTHFSNPEIQKTKSPANLSTSEKLIALLFFFINPRPANNDFPKQNYEISRIQSIEEIECWVIWNDSAKGTVLIFHGFSGDKSKMIDKSDLFLQMGYNTVLVDFMGSGGSSGNRTTIGYFEAQQVIDCFRHFKRKDENIILHGTSMGAVAIMKAIDDEAIDPSAIIIECPFGSMYKTVCARFRSMNVPHFPMAGLLVFWGGIQNGFWAFGHNPVEYAKGIDSPTLLLQGGKDEKVSLEETHAIFENLNGLKEMKIYDEAGHENYLNDYKSDWVNDVNTFLNKKTLNILKHEAK